jgi:hypothetical protein
LRIQKHGHIADICLNGLWRNLCLPSAAHRFPRFAWWSKGRLVVRAIAGVQQRPLLWAITFVRIKLLPLFRIFNLGFQIGGGAAVRADENRV